MEVRWPQVDGVTPHDGTPRAHVATLHVLEILHEFERALRAPQFLERSIDKVDRLLLDTRNIRMKFIHQRLPGLVVAPIIGVIRDRGQGLFQCLNSLYDFVDLCRVIGNRS